jgi:hypothetical protein
MGGCCELIANMRSTAGFASGYYTTLEEFIAMHSWEYFLWFICAIVADIGMTST